MSSSNGNGKPLSPLEELRQQRDLLRTRVISAATRHSNGLFLFGRSGVGKTYTVTEQLEDCGADWVEAPTGLTPQGTLELLEENADKCIFGDDVAEMFGRERTTKYWLRALGDRPDHTEPRYIGYKKEGRERKIEFTGSVIIITNEEICPAAFASRVFCLEYSPTDEQIRALMLDLAQKGNERWRMSPSECLEVTEFLIAESLDGGIRLDMRDQNKASSDYALWRSGKSLVHWKDLVRSMIRQKTVELEHPRPKPQSRQARLEYEREIAGEILRLFPTSARRTTAVLAGGIPRRGRPPIRQTQVGNRRHAKPVNRRSGLAGSSVLEIRCKREEHHAVPQMWKGNMSLPSRRPRLLGPGRRKEAPSYGE